MGEQPPSSSPEQSPQPVEPNAPDRLAALFAMQCELNRYTMANNGQPSLDEIQAEPALTEQWVRNYLLAMQQEIAEAYDSTNWKWWRSRVDRYDPQNLAVELVDILHFWISACQALGLKAEDVYRMYVQKNEVNLKRQEGGYLEKDENDSRHIR